jgi:hypothetical protein
MPPLTAEDAEDAEEDEENLEPLRTRRTQRKTNNRTAKTPGEAIIEPQINTDKNKKSNHDPRITTHGF